MFENEYNENIPNNLICINQGAIQGPGEFAEGLVLGVRSLFGHTVGGAAGAFSRITGAMGKHFVCSCFRVMLKLKNNVI